MKEGELIRPCPDTKPPVFLPDWMIVDWGILPIPPANSFWQRDDNRAGYILSEKP